MEDVLNQLLEKLTKSLGDRLVSVVLYGSAVTGDHHEAFSDLNVLCVLQHVTSSALSDPDVLRRLLADSLSTFCVLIRHAMLLHGVAAHSKKREIIQQANENFGIDPLPFNKLLDLREERIKPRELEPVGLFDSYL